MPTLDSLQTDIEELRSEIHGLLSGKYSAWEADQEVGVEVRARLTAIETRLTTIEGRLGKLENA